MINGFTLWEFCWAQISDETLVGFIPEWIISIWNAIFQFIFCEIET